MLETLMQLLDSKRLSSLLQEWANVYGAWFYLFIFIIIFCETGLIITPFLPGDSLLFVVGTIVGLSSGIFNIHLMALLLIIAAIVGDSTNYALAQRFGLTLLRKQRFSMDKYIKITEEYYAKYGSFTIVLARFVPIVRTIAPFMAGIAQMHYPKFLFYNITGGIVWITLFLYSGYFFGKIPWVQENLSLIFLTIVILSGLPILNFIPLRSIFKKRKNNVHVF